MERIGDIEEQQLSKNEISYMWNFPKVAFNKSYRSNFMIFLPYKNISKCQLLIAPDDIRSVVKFFLIMYGCELRNDSKITFSASFKNKIYPDVNVICSDMCSDLKPSMEIFEIQSSHPILFNSSSYVFQLNLKLHKKLMFTQSHSKSNVSISDIKGNLISAEPLENSECIEYPKQVTQDLKSLFISGDMCDLEICIGEEVLRAHKLILCARSPVFKKMMEHDCLESTSNSITITDYHAPLFRKFLMYLYTGEIEDSSVDTVMSLYSLGDKYDVTLLRESCSNILQSKLFFNSTSDDVANIACDVLQLAECHGDSKLKELAADFIVNHFPAISGKQSWKDLMKNNIELTSEILALVATGLHK